MVYHRQSAFGLPPIIVGATLSTAAHTQPKDAQLNLSIQVTSKPEPADFYSKYVLTTLPSVALPLTILLLGIVLLTVLRRPLRIFLEKTDNLAFKIAGQEISFTRRKAETFLELATKEIFQGLDEPQKALIVKIRESNGRLKVGEIFPGYKRESPQHNLLRSLRGRLIARPQKGTSWGVDKVPEITKFAEAFLADEPKLLEPLTNSSAYLLLDESERLKYEKKIEN